MRRVLRSMICLALVLGLTIPASGQERAGKLPLISELVAPQEKGGGQTSGEEQEEEEDVPRDLATREVVQSIDVLPTDAFLFLKLINAATFKDEVAQTSLAALLEEKDVVRFLRENPLNLGSLMQDLPEDYSATKTTALYTAGLQLARVFATTPGSLALAGYVGSDQAARVVYLANIGRERRAAFEALEDRIESLLQQTPDLILQRSPQHREDYLEVMRTGTALDSPEIAFGFARNFFFITNDRMLGEDLIARAAGQSEEPTLADSQAFSRLAAKTAADSAIRGFLALPQLLTLLANGNLLKARDLAEFAGDLTHRGVLYYDLQADDLALREHLTIPLGLSRATNTLAARLTMVCQREAEMTSENLLSPRLMPYQPDLYAALKVRPADMVSLLLEAELFGTSATAREVSRSKPTVLRRICEGLEDKADEILEGEVGVMLMHNPQSEKRPLWLIAMPLRSAAEAEAALAALGTNSVTVSGIEVYTRTERLAPEDAAWAVFAQTQASFQNLGQSFLVVASSGPVMQTTIDRALGGGAILANNQDFRRQVDSLAGTKSVVLYENLPKAVQTRYPVNLRQLLRECFPRIGTPHALPPLRSISRHLTGIGGAVSITDENEVQLTYVSSVGVMPTNALQLLLLVPRWLRVREETALFRARKHLGDLGLALQEYATQHGHFPYSLAGEVEKRELNALLPAESPLETLLTNPAALLRLESEEEAASKSYVYVPGLLPSDLPSSVILYTSAPWHHHYRTDNRQIYEACRLVLTLDGNITAYSEEDFTKHIQDKIGEGR